jgi:AraC-like DNA-binding protein
MELYRTTFPVSYVKTFLDGIKAEKWELTEIAQHAGLTEKLLSMPDARMTQEQFSMLFQLLVDRFDDEMPCLYGRPLRKGTLKVLIIFLLDAPNLQSALRRWQQFDHILSDEFSFVFKRSSDVISLSIKRYPSDAKNARLVQEFHLKLVHGIASWVIGKNIVLERVDFAFPRPLDASEYVFIFPGPVYFDQAVTAMHIRSSYFDEPVQRRSKLELRDFLFKAPQNWFFVPFDENVLSHQVRRYLEGHLDARTDMRTAALALNQSVRTLGRRLMKEGTTFHQIKDALRRDVAVQMLVKTRKSVDSISAAIGFANITVFHRAFKMWTGGTPRFYRRNHSDQNPCSPPAVH